MKENHERKGIPVQRGISQKDQEWREAMFFLSKGPSSSLEFLNDDTKALLFAYKSQAIDGPCTPLHLSMCPSDPNFMAMQQSWLSLGDMTKEQAKQEFINLLNTILPNWRDWFDKHANLGTFNDDGGEAGRIMKKFYDKGVSLVARL